MQGSPEPGKKGKGCGLHSAPPERTSPAYLVTWDRSHRETKAIITGRHRWPATWRRAARTQSLLPKSNGGGPVLTISSLQMGKLRHRERKWCAQGQTSGVLRPSLHRPGGRDESPQGSGFSAEGVAPPTPDRTHVSLQSSPARATHARPAGWGLWVGNRGHRRRGASQERAWC